MASVHAKVLPVKCFDLHCATINYCKSINKNHFLDCLGILFTLPVELVYYIKKYIPHNYIYLTKFALELILFYSLNGQIRSFKNTLQ